jgi:hypothetical protein
MNKKLMLFAAILICAVLLVALKLIFFKSALPDREILRFVADMNKHCPVMIDVETRLDKVNALADNSLHFNYTLVYRDRDSLHIDHLKQYMEPVIMNKIKTSETLSKFIDKKLTWVYSYNDKKGDFIFKIIYTPEQFK